MEEKFLELYKEMEGLLKEKYMGEATRSGVVMKFINSLEGKRFREKLNTCREIRNILAHSPDIRRQFWRMQHRQPDWSQQIYNRKFSR